MKKIALLTVVASFAAACGSGDTTLVAKATASQKDTANYTTIQWIDTLKNIGTVAPGSKNTIRFRFRNTGAKPLFVVSAQPGCGCTIADYPKEAISPNATGIITAEYTARANAEGDFRKNIHVVTNTRGSDTRNLYFYGYIRSATDSAQGKSPF